MEFFCSDKRITFHFTLSVYVTYLAQQPNTSLGRLNVQVSRSHAIRHTHSAERLWTRDQLVAEAATQETNIHALSGIGTRDPSNREAADLLLIQRRHRDLWNDNDKGNPKVLGEKPVPVPLCPPQILH